MATSRKRLKQGEAVAVDESIPGKDLMTLLLAAGVRYVAISYDGSGDDGQITGVEAFRSAGKSTPDEIELVPSLKDALEELGYRLLTNFVPGDWVNNEGGFGILHLYVSHHSKATLESHLRITSTQDDDIEIDPEDLAVYAQEKEV